MTRKEMLTVLKEVLREEATVDRFITVLSVIDGNRNLHNDQIRTIFTDDVHGTFYIYTSEEGEYENEKPVTKKQALEYIKYYNARLKGDESTEKRLGAKLGVLGIESELRFNHGEIKGDPTVFSLNEGIGMDYLNKTAQEYFGEEDFDAAVKDGNAPNANDVAFYISKNETDEIEEDNLSDFLKKNDYEEKQVAEYQFDEEKYDFSKAGGAGEYDSSIIIFKVVDKSGKHIPIPGDNSNKTYPYLATTDRGSLSEFYPLLEAKHVKILKSIADIFEPNEVYENYKDGKVKGKSRPGRVKKSGASCKGSVTSLRAKAKRYGGEKGKMYHWCANMKGGKK
tara:strand:+ start:3202 stop:4215 length:1014 start_codon:yes stop_codon:yes gene_type:complete